MYGIGYSMFNQGFRLLVGGGAVPFDADAQAFITAASITDPTQQSAVNDLVVGLKADNLWTKMKAVYPFVGGSASTHKWNLKDPRDLDAAYRLTFSGGLTHNANGVTFSTNGYARSYYNLTAGNLYNRAYSEYVRLVTNNNSTGWTGVFDGINVFGNQLAIVSGNLNYAAGLNNLNGLDGPILYGLQTSSVTSGTNASKYYSTDVSITSITANATPTSGEFYLGALNSGGSAILYCNKNISFSSISDSLTQTDVTNLNNLVQTFQTALSRNV
jgi:hypothetical protein